jgi:RNA recognition motif-containing protein
MSVSVFVGNLNYDATEADLKAFFEGFGAITKVKIPLDKESNRPRGFGFVEFENNADAQKAIEGVNGREFMGRELNVNEARPMERRSGGGGGGGGGYGRGGGGGGREGNRRDNRW